MTRDLHSHGDSSRREELMREGERHPTPEQIAALLDPSGPPPDQVDLRAHLAACRRCFGLFTEMAESHLTQEWSRTAEPVPADLVRRAKAMDETPVASLVRRPARTGAWAAAIAAVVLAGSAIWFVRDHGEIKTIKSAVARASVGAGGMVLTADVEKPGAPTRSGGAARASLTRAVNELAREYDARPSADAAYWVAAGMLADDDRDVGNRLSEATEQFPGDLRLENLAAVTAYREDRFDDARETLHAILEKNPRDPMALFNNVVLTDERGTPEELHQACQKLYAALPDSSPLRERADAFCVTRVIP